MAWQVWMNVGKVLTPFITARVVERVREKTDIYIDRKRNEFVSHARTEAEQFMAEQMILIEARVDAKIDEIERRFDALIEKEIRTKLRILVLTLCAVIGMSLLSLGYLYLKHKMGV
ncbi:MAG: hypothetical protein EPO39_01505 [Candidatus Manganitrophaceae bacterium]|nr:MAG: hypothetical protein EPO39_01505 [Candidatus Manganitrophaceae bacterium]